MKILETPLKTSMLLLHIFVEGFPQLVDSMKSSEHGTDGRLNPYHTEGDIFTHTMMVFKEAITRYPDNYLLQIATLLHDIGKPSAREEFEKNEIKKVRFVGHEGISVYKAIDILNSKAFEVFELTQDEKLLIINTIALHGSFFDSFDSGKQQEKMENKFTFRNSDTLELVQKHLICDHNGRLCTEPHDSRNVEEYIVPRFGTRGSAFINFTSEIVLFVGPPCSGKSTEYNKNYTNHVKISRDDALLEYGLANYPELNYSQLFKTLTEDEQKEIDKLVQTKFQSSVKSGENIVIDMTNMSPKSRRKWLTNVPKEYKKRAVVFYTGHNTLVERNTIRAAETGKYIPEKVLISMFKNFTPPMYDEVDEIEYII